MATVSQIVERAFFGTFGAFAFYGLVQFGHSIARYLASGSY